MSDPSSEINPLDQLAEEFVDRYRKGERPPLSEYVARHPDLADEIRDLFPGLVLMEGIRPETGEATGAFGVASGASKCPERLGDYRILREVGRGGMGIVYEAEQESLGRHVALKVLASHALLEPKHLHRFQREAKAAARLHHSNIVPVYGVGSDEGLHYYVMQFIQGQGLDQVLHELKRLRHVKGAEPPNPSGGTGALSAAAVAQALLIGTSSPTRRVSEGPSPPQNGSTSETIIQLSGHSSPPTLSQTGRAYWQSVARVGIQVAEALAYAHGQGTLHRDIKPSNLLLDADGVVWVTDFGLAKASADTEDLTHSGDIVGTLRYMAPERFQGRSDARSDLYALGLTLYELMTLGPAFDSRDRNQLIQQVLHDEPVRPRKVNPAVPHDLETIVLKTIDRDPSRRYQTAAAMVEDLKRFVEDRPIRARRVSRGERLWRWCRRNPAVASLLTALVLTLLVGLAGVTWKWREAEKARRDEQTALDAAEFRAEENRQILEDLREMNRLVASGRMHTGAHDWAQADAEFTKATQLRPDDYLPWYERGQLYWQLRLWEAASADLVKAYQLQDPVGPRDVFTHAVLRGYVGDIDSVRALAARLPAVFVVNKIAGRAENEIVRACNLVPGHGVDRAWAVQFARNAVAGNRVVWNLFALAGAHYRAGEYDQALQRFREALAVDPNWPPHCTTHLFLAMTHHRLGQGEEARQELGKANELLVRLHKGASVEPADLPPLGYAVEWIEHLVIYREAKTLVDGSPPPDDPQDDIVRARAWAVLHKSEQSDAAYAKATAARPDDVGIRLQGVWMNADLNRWDKADAEYALAAKLRIDDPQFHLDAFRMFARLKQWERADATYAKAAALKPNDPQIRLEGFQLYADLGEWDKALAEHAKAVQFRPEDLNLWLVCLRYHVNRSQWEKADAELKRLRALRPKDAKLPRMAGDLFGQQNRWQSAADALAASLAVEPNQADVWNHKAVCHYRLQQWDKALDAITEAVERKPDSALFWRNRATTLVELARWDRAVEDFAKAVNLAPDDPNLQYEHALTCLSAGQAGDYQEACIRMMQRFEKRVDPSIAYLVVLACTVGPNAQAEEKENLASYLKKLEDAGANNPVNVSLMGRAHYRQGEFEAAVKHLDEAERLRGKGDELDCFFLAMAHHRLGHADEAQRRLDKGVRLAKLQAKSAQRQTAQNTLFRKAAQLLRREAEALLHVEPKTPKQ
jgi:serine/threonine protein kinase/Flp pilus assembly protein TadD